MCVLTCDAAAVEFWFEAGVKGAAAAESLYAFSSASLNKQQ